jgi:hypothetical protein
VGDESISGHGAIADHAGFACRDWSQVRLSSQQ